MIFEWRGNANSNFFSTYFIGMWCSSEYFRFAVTAPKVLFVKELNFLSGKPSVVRRIAKVGAGIKNFKKKVRS